METINRIELRGTIGSVRLQTVGGTKMANFTVATNTIYKNRSGETVIETDWTSCEAFENRKIQGLYKLQKGSKIYVCGRLRNKRYTGADGSDRAFTSVLVNELKFVNEEQ